MQPETPKPTTGQRCEIHGLQRAPDGSCTLCRRANAQPPEASSGGWLNIVLGVIAALGLALVLFWAFKPGDPVSEAPKGPSLKDQIAVVDKQLVELRRARRYGELGAQGLNALSQLENKRKLLVAAQEAQEQ